MADPEGGQGVQTLPLKNHKNIGFLFNNGPDLLRYCTYANIQGHLSHRWMHMPVLVCHGSSIIMSFSMYRSSVVNCMSITA